MGPWLCSHGNRILQIDCLSWRDPSMGPWLCSHGNPTVTA